MGTARKCVGRVYLLPFILRCKRPYYVVINVTDVVVSPKSGLSRITSQSQAFDCVGVCLRCSFSLLVSFVRSFISLFCFW